MTMNRRTLLAGLTAAATGLGGNQVGSCAPGAGWNMSSVIRSWAWAGVGRAGVVVVATTRSSAAVAGAAAGAVV